MKYVDWEDIQPKFQEQLLWYERQNMLLTREHIIEKFGIEYANEVWYTKMDYIDNWKYPEGYLFEICEDCGRPRQLMVCLKDEPIAYQQRHCVYKCPCGRIHHTY
jgi:hypothetical protein